MSKPTIFLSHITEEAELAGLFKEQIETSFLGMVNVFVSSDAKSIPLGKNWLDQVTEGLRSCKAMLLLCSPASIGRPWINFEAGAAWARAIEVAPICHSGLRPVDLPPPMSLLQGLEANDARRVDQVFQLIAKQLDSAAPAIDVAGLVAKVRAFEAPYIVRLRYAADAKALKALNGGLVRHINAQQPETTLALNSILERDFVHIRPHLDNLQDSGGLQYSYNVDSMVLGGPGSGSRGTLTVRASKELHDLLKQ
ncbi:toll/interleukin-1 receptor domain-containing protein [Rhizobium leguminosarum]|uniref:toll/interleukin-1 receptor domain-containing protein n=1 Tax=Rhizobium leguminosarum TaxID=384 RepID=UPI001C976287|nr:toll/interleukin-1 receptor domain-containing protein [Rhizobium leguminosarum]MBY5682664.1 toll/interleukin-1 receptor domain-containing protein [Rhizobium leguminosarum]